MRINQLNNCSRCGKLFFKDHSDCCLDCYKEIEKDFKGVSDFLKSPHNRYATIEDVSEFTSVPVNLIADFMRDGRIYAEDYPNLGYECARCGKLIRRQVLCHDCFNEFSSEVNQSMKRENLVTQIEKGRMARNDSRSAQYWKLKQ